jgi:hypothetical protein
MDVENTLLCVLKHTIHDGPNVSEDEIPTTRSRCMTSPLKAEEHDESEAYMNLLIP